MNASKITFPDLEQTFIACQAPKPLSFKHFWHMVIQEQVKIDEDLLTKLGILKMEANYVLGPKNMEYFSGYGDRDGDSPGGEEEEKSSPVLA